MATTDIKEKWHKDKRIPVASLMGLAIQTTLFVWWFATFTATTNGRIDTLEQWIKDNKTITTDLVVVKTNQTFIKETLQRIENKLK